MQETPKLNSPWLVAVWPGMGNVAVSAGYYLMAKLGMRFLSEYSADEMFDADHVVVKAGMISPAKLPRNRFFYWSDPRSQRDIVVFIGEAQPPLGKHRFCSKLIDFAESFGVQRVFTFAAMATAMRPEAPSRVFCAATNSSGLTELQDANLHTLDDGNIGGLNGLLLGVAADYGLPGACLLGEMPHVFHQFPYPKASLGVLRAFNKLADIKLDLDELTQQAEAVDQQLIQLLAKMESAITQHSQKEEDYQPELQEEERLRPEDESRIEAMFEVAKQDRARAFELKQELDRLGVFADYEDRFLDLFKSSE